MRNFKFTLAYDGTDFHGWQRQVGLRTVQQTLEEAIEEIVGSACTTTASGRTDAGVHALGQVVQFFASTRLEPSILMRGVNAKLSADVRVIEASEVSQAFHATFDTKSKRYRYQIDNGAVADPFLRRVAWHVPRVLDETAMHRAGQVLVGRHDFRSFETDWPNRMSSVRTIVDLSVARSSSRVLIEVEADGFLYNMVRCIAGTLARVGTGARSEEFVGQALAAHDRTKAGPNAPPQGLFLVSVRY
jgi:tRNA pseudouridine38-40 synthase